MQKIKYYTKHVYGNKRLYIKDDGIARTVWNLTGRATINEHDIDALKNLGHEVIEVIPPKDA